MPRKRHGKEGVDASRPWKATVERGRRHLASCLPPLVDHNLTMGRLRPILIPDEGKKRPAYAGPFPWWS